LKRVILCFISLFLVSASYPRELIKSSIDASYVISFAEGNGSGVAFYRDESKGITFVMTNDHVCQLSRGLTLYKEISKKPLNTFTPTLVNKDGVRFQAKVLYTSDSRKDVSRPDLCIIGTKNTIPTTTLGVQMSSGSKVYSVGGPQGFFPFVDEGYFIDHYKNTEVNTDAYTLKAYFGSSGSGVFDYDTGKIVGIIFAMITYDDESIKAPFITYAVPLTEIRSFIKEFCDKNKLKWTI